MHAPTMAFRVVARVVTALRRLVSVPIRHRSGATRPQVIDRFVDLIEAKLFTGGRGVVTGQFSS